VALTSPTGGGRSVGIVRSRTKAMEFSLVLVWCYKPTGDREHDLRKYWLPEADSAAVWQAYGWRLPLQEVWTRGAMKHWHCCNLYLGHVLWCAVCKHNVQKHSWQMPLTRISIDVADSSVIPLLFLRCLSIFSGSHNINTFAAGYLNTQRR
jgi:hypothetical protein